jgi:hypothetical protein
LLIAGGPAIMLQEAKWHTPLGVVGGLIILIAGIGGFIYRKDIGWKFWVPSFVLFFLGGLLFINKPDDKSIYKNIIQKMHDKPLFLQDNWVYVKTEARFPEKIDYNQAESVTIKKAKQLLLRAKGKTFASRNVQLSTSESQQDFSQKMTEQISLLKRVKIETLELLDTQLKVEPIKKINTFFLFARAKVN